MLQQLHRVYQMIKGTLDCGWHVICHCTLGIQRSIVLQILVRMFSGRTITLDVEASNNIDDVKAAIHDKEGISSHQ